MERLSREMKEERIRENWDGFEVAQNQCETRALRLKGKHKVGAN